MTKYNRILPRLVLNTLISFVLAGATRVSPVSAEQMSDTERQLQNQVEELQSKYRDRPEEARAALALALFHLGHCLYQEGKFSQARERLIECNNVERSTKENARDGGISDQLIADCCCHLSQYGEAEKYYQAALARAKEDCQLNKEAISPALASAWLGLAQVYERTGREAAAETAYRQTAVGVDAREAQMAQRISSPQVFDRLASYLALRGQTEEAEKWWLKVVHMRASAHAYSCQADALEHYAAMLRKQDRAREAEPLEKHARELRSTEARLVRNGLQF